MADYLWPYPVAFYYKVQIENLGILSFSEVSGLNMSITTEHLDEGGTQGYDVPTKVSHGNLICKRVISTDLNDQLTEWMNQHFERYGKVLPKKITVSLLNSDGERHCSWILTDAYPIKWNVNSFSSQKNELAMETMEFAYHEIRRV